MRLTLVCTTASTEPTRRLRTASAHTIGRQSVDLGPNVEKKIRSSAANPAALAAAAMKPVTGVGEPWYTSGVHMWNGTAATLKPRPTISSAIPPSITPVVSGRSRMKAEMMPKLVEPVAPYVSATPYRKNADENAPSTKYLI